jgi:hypothetical protein
MSERRIGTDYPRRVGASQKQGGEPFELQEDHYAVHGPQAGSRPADALFELAGGAISVHRGEAPAGAARDEQIGPVYARPEGPLAVPTGLLFVRFGEGDSAAEHREEIERRGYEIVDIPAYAPHTAWVRDRKADIASSLRGMDALSSMPGVENVEPQMLMQSARR